MFRARDAWVSLSKRLKFLQSRSFCSKKPNNGSDKPESDVQRYTRLYEQARKDLENNPDLATLIRIWLTFPTKRRKIGIDYYIVHGLLACLPALGMYKLAMYARSEMRRRDAELALERRLLAEINSAWRNQEIEESPAIAEVRERLGHLEEVVNEIKRLVSYIATKDQEDEDAEKQPATIEPSETQVSSESSNSVEKGLGKPKQSEHPPGSSTKDA